eukprot:TRINITY_DN242_c0_g1_i1.p2 TRINITY_DN242_c0_g1~~TRINITY_DN242_c0_g1_i1.p2  ORF type:complete len:231 (+),score=123.20 TRINITY_DN242_c0_g1_i1:53-745(+)
MCIRDRYQRRVRDQRIDNKDNMVSLKLQKRLAAAVLKCGRHKVWLDPNEVNEISSANSRKNIRKLAKDGYILRKPNKIHSRSRTRRREAAKRKGRHMGLGKRRGTKNARNPPKRQWIKRIRTLRRLLKKYRAKKRIAKSMYHELYLKAKGNAFRNKRVLIEHIHRQKSELKREKLLAEQSLARRERNKVKRARMQAKKDQSQSLVVEKKVADKKSKKAKVAKETKKETKK